MPWTSAAKRAVESSITCLGLAVLFLACGDVTAFPSSGVVPVVQLLLVAGESTQIASVTYSNPAEPIVPVIERPVSSDSVLLELVASDGTRAPLEVNPGSPTQYEAELLVVPGGSYQLVGTVAGLAVSASVTVPGSLEIVEPPGDTLSLSASSFFLQLDFSWSAAGAVSYLVRQVDDEGGLILSRVFSDTAGSLPLISQFPDRPDTNRLSIWAYEQSGATFFLNRGVPTPPLSGASSAVVGFGAATPAVPEKTILWRPE